MKLVSYKSGENESYGTVKDGGIVDLGARLGATHPDLASILDLQLDTAQEIVASASPDVSVDDVTFLPVIPRPSKILMAAVNYLDHLEEANNDHTENPAASLREQQ